MAKETKSKGLSDKALAKKYDTGKKLNFDKILNKLAKTPAKKPKK